MIQLKKLFTPVEALDPEQAKEYISAHPEGSFTLLDVRQPWEYEEAHLPGAKLIPLAELPGQTAELDPQKPVIAYCAVGGRSRVAAQLLAGLGFEEVYNLSGGIKAWQGEKATGPQELSLDLVRGDETPAEILVLAYGMEKALKIFYETLHDRSGDPALKDLFAKLGHIEELHQKSLFERYQTLDASVSDQGVFEAAIVPQVMEGGFNLEAFLANNAPHVNSTPGMLELALMLETQALDLYLRLGDKVEAPAAKEVLFRIAQEEKAHLAALARLLDERRG